MRNPKLVVPGALVVSLALASTASAQGPIFEQIALGVTNVQVKTSFVKGLTTIDLRKATIPVGGAVPWHCHPGPTTFIVTQGVLTTFAPDGSSSVLGPGDADVEQIGAVRMSQNLGTVDVVVYIQFGPPDGLPPTIWLTGPNDACVF
jgi:quercetin dioxygenase-like cupin family protein